MKSNLESEYSQPLLGSPEPKTKSWTLIPSLERAKLGGISVALIAVIFILFYVYVKNNSSPKYEVEITEIDTDLPSQSRSRTKIHEKNTLLVDSFDDENQGKWNKSQVITGNYNTIYAESKASGSRYMRPFVLPAEVCENGKRVRHLDDIDRQIDTFQLFKVCAWVFIHWFSFITSLEFNKSLSLQIYS